MGDTYRKLKIDSSGRLSFLKESKSVSIEAFAEHYRDHGFFVVDDDIDVSSGSQELHLSQAAIAVIGWLGLDET